MVRTMKKMLERLRKITKDCRDDMHEPDEQGISVIVSGYHLDNAMGDNPCDNCGEFTIAVIKNRGMSNEEWEWFNLATLIALARKARL